MRAPVPKPQSDLGTVVVWRTGALGDFVLTLPVLSALAERASRLIVVAPARYRPLVVGADRWIDAEGAEAAAWIAGRTRVDADLGVAWTATAAEALRSVGVRDVRTGDPHPPPGVHQADALWRPIRELVGPRDRDPAVPIGPVDHVASHRGAVVIAPGSGGARKRRPIGWWQEVAARVARPVLWVGGPVEAEEPGWGAPRRDDLDVPGLIALAAVCHAWVGPDAGPQHLASAAGARVGAVFVGETDPACWAPCGATVFGPSARPSDLARWLAT